MYASLCQCLFIVSLVPLSKQMTTVFVHQTLSFTEFHLTTFPAGPKPPLIITGTLLDHCRLNTSNTVYLTAMKCWDRCWGAHTHTHTYINRGTLGSWGHWKQYLSKSIEWKWSHIKQCHSMCVCVLLWVFMCSPACMSVCQWPNNQCVVTGE